MSAERVVCLVHVIDTEGPLYESLEAKFERLNELYGLTGIAPTPANLTRLQHAEVPLNGLERDVAQMLTGHRVAYNETWDQIEAMLRRVTTPEFRRRLPDSFGGGWVYNWFCVDHVGYEYNPRRRDIGYHNVLDHYRAVLPTLPGTERDALHWHFHPMSIYRDAHRCATSYVNSSELYQILCRKLIERGMFPSAFRAGFQTERPDSHWFLEQWIPFDLSNMAVEDPTEFDQVSDFRKGRSGDWRSAPADWSVYHPSHDNYQLPGHCRRWIARSLNVMSRIANLDQREMDKAFARAAEGKPVLVGMASHDFRDLGVEVPFLMDLVNTASHRYPTVLFKYCEAVEAFRSAIWPEGISGSPLDLDVTLHPHPADDVPWLEIVTTSGRVFGPQPFLAIQTVSRRFIHDNLDFSPSLDRWYYAFHGDTLPLEDVARIGVAANDHAGNACVKVLDVQAMLAQARQHEVRPPDPSLSPASLGSRVAA